MNDDPYTILGKTMRTREDGQDFLVVPSLSVRNTDLDLAARAVQVGDVATQRGTLRVIRSAAGKINLLGLVPAPAPAAAPAPADALAAASPAAAPAAPWRARVTSLAIDQYAVSISDAVPKAAVTLRLDGLRLKAQGLSTEPGTTGTLALGVQIETTGAVAVRAASASPRWRRTCRST